MSKWLCGTQLVYRVDTFEEAEALINKARNDNHYEFVGGKTTYKETKEKGQIVDTYYLVKIDAKINDPKTPDRDIQVTYSIDY